MTTHNDINQNTELHEATNALKVASKVIAVIAKVVYIAMIVAMCLCVVAIVATLVTGHVDTVVKAGESNIIFANGLGATVWGVVASCIALLAMFGLIFVISLLLQHMFHEISTTGQPFEKRYGKTVRTVAILTACLSIVVGVVLHVVPTATESTPQNLLDKAPGILSAVIIYCLSYVIDYGCAIKK